MIDGFEAQGVAQVRTRIASGNFPTNFMQDALIWLKSKDDELASLQSLSNAEMAAIASRSAVAAERAAAAAESQAKAADEQASAAREQARIAQKALNTARFAAGIGLIALILSIFTYYLQL